MSTRFRSTIVVLLVLLVPILTIGDDGMWMPHQMKWLNLNKLGLKMNPDEMFRPDGLGLANAVVNLGGGTGAFVSAEGLILTNHHVAFGAIQRASTPENDYIRDGFIAWNRSDEIQAPGNFADVLIDYVDVTARVSAAVKPGMSSLERYEALEQAKRDLVAETEKKGPDIRASVATMYNGCAYYLFTTKRIRDIRLVYSPPQDLGNFGGEVDNWMWPRHTCDFAMFRAYVSKDNAGVEYRPDNVPYKPPSVVKITREGVKEGDFTFIIGYPGRTYRTDTAFELENNAKRMEKNIENNKILIGFYEEAGRGDREIEIKYASRVKGLYNGMKNNQGKLEGFAKHGILGKKKAADRALQAWIDADPQRRARYGNALDSVRAVTAKNADYTLQTQTLNGMADNGGSTLLTQAFTILRAAERKKGPSAGRDEGTRRGSDNPKADTRRIERSYDFEIDRALLKFQFKRLFDLPLENIPAALKPLIVKKSGPAVDAYVDDLYDRTTLSDPEVRASCFDLTYDSLRALREPLIELAADIQKEIRSIRDQGRALDQEVFETKQKLLAAELERTAGKMAPDANSTIRFSSGRVEGYSPKDAVWYKPLTTLSGILEKDTGVFPFHVPDTLKTLESKRDFGPYRDAVLDDVPTCFLNETNVTGGNSGSPTFNARGEQVGIIFDMTYESVIGDYYIIPELQRSVSVDIRFVLFVLDKFSGADHIVKEMNIK
jgi:hypothetical protein